MDTSEWPFDRLEETERVGQIKEMVFLASSKILVQQNKSSSNSHFNYRSTVSVHSSVLTVCAKLPQLPTTQTIKGQLHRQKNLL